MKINVFWGVLILATLVAIIIPNTNNVRLSPNGEDSDYQFETNVGVLHANCAEACSNLDNCKTSESYEKDNQFICECKECETTKDFKIISEDRNFK